MLPYLLEYEAKTRAEAEKRSLAILGLEAQDVKFETVSSSGGIRRLFAGSPVVLRTLALSEDISQESVTRGVIHTLLYKLGMEADISQIEERDDNLYVNLACEYSSILIGRHGRTLDSLQFLLNLLVSRKIRNGKRIIVDVSDYRKRRRQSIEALCSKVASKVVRNGRPITLNYMSPYERRIVHMLLEDNEHVYTESIGNSVYKRVRILPEASEQYDDQEDDYDYNDQDTHDNTYDEQAGDEIQYNQQNDDYGNRKDLYQDEETEDTPA